MAAENHDGTTPPEDGLDKVDQSGWAEVEQVRQEVSKELSCMFTKKRDSIRKLGATLLKVVSDPGTICQEIKNQLREEIKQHLISKRDIERYCPREWKNRKKSDAGKVVKGKSDDKMSSEANIAQKRKKMVAVENFGRQLEDHSLPDTPNSDIHCPNCQELMDRNRGLEEQIEYLEAREQAREEDKEFARESYANNVVAENVNGVDFEFYLIHRDLRRYMESRFKADGDVAKVYFNGTIDSGTGLVVRAYLGRIAERVEAEEGCGQEVHTDSKGSEEETEE
jgi:hypothetical protein